MKQALVIEDDPTTADVYRQRLGAQGFSVEINYSGRKGLETVANHRPDIVILDLILPEMSGLDVLKAIRARDNCRSLPVLVLSKADAKDIVQQARQAGATEVLAKSSCTPQQMAEIAHTLANPGSLSPTQAAVNESEPVSDDSAFEAELRTECLQNGPMWLQAIQSSFQLFSKDLNDTAVLHSMRRNVHSMGGNTGLAGLQTISALAGCLEALIEEVGVRPHRVKSSVLRTIAQSLDLLTLLFQQPIPASQDKPLQARVIAVDDQEIALRAVVRSLEKLKFRPVAETDPNVALAQATENEFDLIVSDIEMPGMLGTELCAKLRALPQYKKTPVIFVTSATDYDHRVQVVLSGGTDLIAKPFLFNELALKALTLLVQSRIQKS